MPTDTVDSMGKKVEIVKKKKKTTTKSKGGGSKSKEEKKGKEKTIESSKSFPSKPPYKEYKLPE